MASITVGAGGLDSLLSSVRRQVESKWRDATKAAEEAAEFGASTAQSYTRSRPGAKTGKAGRVESGDMVDAIRHKVVSVSADLVQTQYGFVSDPETYFITQTVTGFTHNRSGAYIAPTFALRDSIGPTGDFARAAAGRIA